MVAGVRGDRGRRCVRPGRRSRWWSPYKSWKRGSTPMDSLGRFEIETLPAPVDWEIVLWRGRRTEAIARLPVLWGNRTDSLDLVLDC